MSHQVSRRSVYTEAGREASADSVQNAVSAKLVSPEASALTPDVKHLNEVENLVEVCFAKSQCAEAKSEAKMENLPEAILKIKN
jgi:hypothetical protein